MRHALINLPRKSKQLFMLALDAFLLPIALWSAIVLRQYPNVPDIDWRVFVFLPILTIPIFVNLGLYRAVIRYMEDKVVFTIMIGVALSTVVLVLMEHFIEPERLSGATYILYAMMSLLYVGGSRMIMRGYIRRMGREECGDAVPIAIYGAGMAGMQLLSALRLSRGFRPVAFFDDSPDLQGSVVGGVKVHSPKKLSEKLKELSVKRVFLAIPSASRTNRQEIVMRLERERMEVMTIPDISELMSGKARIEQVRQISLEDLLGRDPVEPDPELLSACIRGKVVMVTGAGGSIGSELCRQVMLQSPKRLIMFELSEFALYSIDQELRSLAKDVEIVPILGSVTHRRRIADVMKTFGVQTVYHAAAYKHVPLVEQNIIEGVRNNVFGTWYAATAASEAGIESFIMISTDKAVRPTNVMGASKRFAELILQGLSREGGNTRFCMVRFGNVLGSSGSVVPLFRKQIQDGGPVTVTHAEITRYFMTIPEAAQLVMQAGSMGQGGDVFVLDMGKPVRIVDLARKMIHLSGLTIRDEEHPEGDIDIEFTGLRPGEKLYEELLIGEHVLGTRHPQIMRAEERELPWSALQQYLEKLDFACHGFDCRKVRDILLEVVDGYLPQCNISDHVWQKYPVSKRETDAVIHHIKQ